jgi:hypothetical protein
MAIGIVPIGLLQRLGRIGGVPWRSAQYTLDLEWRLLNFGCSQKADIDWKKQPLIGVKFLLSSRLDRVNPRRDRENSVDCGVSVGLKLEPTACF